MNIAYLSFMLYFANLSFFKGNHTNKAYILQQNLVVNHQYSVPTIYQRVSRTCILNKVLIF